MILAQEFPARRNLLFSAIHHLRCHGSGLIQMQFTECQLGVTPGCKRYLVYAFKPQCYLRGISTRRKHKVVFYMPALAIEADVNARIKSGVADRAVIFYVCN